MRDQYGIATSKPTADSSLSIAVPTWITNYVELLFATGKHSSEDFFCSDGGENSYMTCFVGNLKHWMITPWVGYDSSFRTITKSSASESQCSYRPISCLLVLHLSPWTPGFADTAYWWPTEPTLKMYVHVRDAVAETLVFIILVQYRQHGN